MLLLCIALQVNAQEKTIPVEIVVEKLSHKNVRAFLEKTTESIFKLYHKEANPENLLTSSCIIVQSTEKERSVNLADDPVLSPMKALKVFRVNQNTEVITLKLETFKNDRGELCNYDKGDNHFSVVSMDIKLSELAPGVFSAPITMVAKDEKFTATFRVRYGLPATKAIRYEGLQKINNAVKPVQLVSGIELANKTNLNYLWEYRLESEGEWKELGKTSSESIEFNPNKDLFKKNIKSNQTVHVRMKAVSSELAGQYSEMYDMQFSPPAPQLNVNEIVPQETCPNAPSGILSVKGVIGAADHFAYYIIKGSTIEEADYPDEINPTKKIASGKNPFDRPLQIPKLPEGEFTLVLYNADMAVGKLFVTHPFTIKKYPLLSIKKEDASDATCASIPDGQILIETEGGMPGKLVYSITPNKGKASHFDRSLMFTELPPDSYTVFVKDQCSQSIATREIVIRQKAVKISGSVEVTNEPINNFSNGSVRVHLQGGTGQYMYTVYKGTAASGLDRISQDTSWLLDNLTKGSYRLKVNDMAFPLCPGWDTSFTVVGKTISADTLQKQSQAADTIKSNSRAILPGSYHLHAAPQFFALPVPLDQRLFLSLKQELAFIRRPKYIDHVMTA